MVGIAGGPEKCALRGRRAGLRRGDRLQGPRTCAKALREHCPDGIDVYFDNVGGEILDAALAHLTRHARVVICGAISQYNNEDGQMRGPSNYMSLLVNHATMTGFVVFDYARPLRTRAARRWPAGWPRASCARARTSSKACETFPDTLLKLFRGENQGKLVLAVAGD